jgi:ribosomal protein S18 acetylase RimI-like enzyme
VARDDPEPVLALRPIQDQDRDFVYRVYSATRAEELAPLPWTEQQKAAFLHQQFEAQRAHYQQHYHDTRYDLILADGEPVGRLYVARWATELRIVDIALLPEHRGRGIGTRLVAGLLAEAATAGLPVTIHVEMNSPALAWYERLGFVRQHDDGVLYCFMAWRPGAQ